MLVALGLGAVAGCGSGADLLAEPASAALHGDVQAIRGALAQDRDPAARAAVGSFRERVHRLADAGEIDPRDAVALLAQADRIAAEIEPSAPLPSATAAPERVETVRITVNRAGPARAERDDDSDNDDDKRDSGKKDKTRSEGKENRDARDDDDRGNDDDGDDD